MTVKVRFRVVIPARYGSSRLPGKPLVRLGGRPMIEHVFRRARASGASEVVVATDDARIREVAAAFGAPVVMTRPDHASGTDRLAEVATLCGWGPEEIVVNLQGDEPLMPPDLLQQVAIGLHEHADAGISTLATPLHDYAEVHDPNAVKVVTDARGYALYFSRAPIPYWRDGFAAARGALPPGTHHYRHIGLYAYRCAALAEFSRWPACDLEGIEALEQLRALWNGVRIHVGVAEQPPPAGVDTPADAERVDALLRASGEGVA